TERSTADRRLESRRADQGNRAAAPAARAGAGEERQVEKTRHEVLDEDARGLVPIPERVKRLLFSETPANATVEPNVSRGSRAMSGARRIGLVLGLLVCLHSSASAQEPRRTPVMVAVGDSITAGFANATLVEETQRLSYPALIAHQMGIFFGQPYVAEPG